MLITQQLLEKKYCTMYCVRVANSPYFKGYYSSLERAKEILELEKLNMPQHTYAITSGFVGALTPCKQWGGDWLINKSLLEVPQ